MNELVGLVRWVQFDQFIQFVEFEFRQQERRKADLLEQCSVGCDSLRGLGLRRQALGLDRCSKRSAPFAEESLLRQIFKNKISYDRIRIKRGGILGITNSAVTMEYTITYPPQYWLNDYCSNGISMKAWLVHEATHVWQYEKVVGYHYSKPAREILNLDKAAYWYMLYDPSQKLHNFRFEQQASIVQDYYYLINNYYPINNLDWILYGNSLHKYLNIYRRVVNIKVHSDLSHRLPGRPKDTKVMKSTTHIHNKIAHSIFEEPNDLFYNSAALNTAVDMLNTHSAFGQFPIGIFLLQRKLLSPRLLDGCDSYHSVEFKSLKTQILQELASRGQRIGSGVGYFLIVHFALNRITQKDDVQSFIDQEHVLHRMLLFLAAVVEFLIFRVLRARYASLRAVMTINGAVLRLHDRLRACFGLFRRREDSLRSYG